MVDECTKITHSHQDAINGAKLQCAAVHLALHHQGVAPLDVHNFVSNLRQMMEQLEKASPQDDKQDVPSPQRKRRTKRYDQVVLSKYS